MPCTVIRPGDVADRFLDRTIYPEWHGQRTRLLESLPTNLQLWEEYNEVRREGLRNGDGGQAGNAFFKRHRRALEAGAVANWPERKNDDELSAIQHAMNLKLRDERAFWAEYQNEPLSDDVRPQGLLTADQIAAKLSGLDRGVAPVETNHLVAFIDVQQDLLYWLVMALADNFTSHIVDYGAWPDPKLRYFTLSSISYSTSDAAKAAALKSRSLQSVIYWSLGQVVDELVARAASTWRREDGAAMHLEKIAIDANWGKSTETVKKFCRASPQSGLLIPSHGRYVGASRDPAEYFKRRRGDRAGERWRYPAPAPGAVVRHLLWDTNYWKSRLHQQLATPLGDRGCLTLPGHAPAENRMFADHALAEVPTEVTAKDRTSEEWNLPPHKPDNHLFDCAVGCLVLGAFLGCVLVDPDPSEQKPKRRRRLSELQREKRSRRAA